LRLKVRGTSYRTLRVVGTIVMFIAVGLLFFAGLLMGMLQSYESTDPAARLAPSIAMAMSGFVFVIGAGLFFSSRFVERPAESDPRNGSPGE
jgi:hypothetical protein